MWDTFKSNTCASFLLLGTRSWIKWHFGCSRQFQFFVNFHFFFKKKEQEVKVQGFGDHSSLAWVVVTGYWEHRASAPWQTIFLDFTWLTSSASAANTVQSHCLPIHLPSQPPLSHQQMPPSPARPNCISRNASGNASTSLSPLSCLAGWGVQQPLQH